MPYLGASGSMGQCQGEKGVKISAGGGDPEYHMSQRALVWTPFRAASWREETDSTVGSKPSDWMRRGEMWWGAGLRCAMLWDGGGRASGCDETTASLLFSWLHFSRKFFSTLAEPSFKRIYQIMSLPCSKPLLRIKSKLLRAKNRAPGDLAQPSL